MKKSILISSIVLLSVLSLSYALGNVNAQATYGLTENCGDMYWMVTEETAAAPVKTCTQPAGDWTELDIFGVYRTNYTTYINMTVKFCAAVNITAIELGYFSGMFFWAVNSTLDPSSLGVVSMAFSESGGVFTGTVVINDGDLFDYYVEDCAAVVGDEIRWSVPIDKFENITNLADTFDWAAYGYVIYSEYQEFVTYEAFDMYNWNDSMMELAWSIACNDIDVPGYDLLIILGVSAFVVTFIIKRKNFKHK